MMFTSYLDQLPSAFTLHSWVGIGPVTMTEFQLLSQVTSDIWGSHWVGFCQLTFIAWIKRTASLVSTNIGTTKAHHFFLLHYLSCLWSTQVFYLRTVVLLSSALCLEAQLSQYHFPFGSSVDTYATEMIPFNRTPWIITSYHRLFSIPPHKQNMGDSVASDGDFCGLLHLMVHLLSL